MVVGNITSSMPVTSGHMVMPVMDGSMIFGTVLVLIVGLGFLAHTVGIFSFGLRNVNIKGNDDLDDRPAETARVTH